MNNNKIFTVQAENKQYLNILRTRANDVAAEHFIKVLNEKDSPAGIINSPNEIRIVYERILRECTKKIPKMRENCTDNYQNTILGGHTIKWLHDKNHIGIIQRQFFFSMVKITSELSHASYEHPTPDTLNALVYMLKDMIIWFDGICRKYS